MKHAYSAAMIAASFLWGASTASAVNESDLPTYKISGEVLNSIDDRIFGGFFEKATWHGEIGSEAAINKDTGEFIPEVIEFIEWMDIPILRYPGGTAIDYYPWYFLIDTYPGHHTERPPNLNYRDLTRTDVVTTDGRTGLHEFMQLCRKLDIEPLIVTNLGDAFYKKRSIDKAAQLLGSDLVEYCNATSGKWSELRAKNGSPEPFNVKFFQIGNETWLFDDFKKKDRKQEDLNHYTDCVIAYAEAMKAADPSIELIIDGHEDLADDVMERRSDLIDYLTFHSYSPWGINEIKQAGEPVDPAAISPKDMWQALTSTPWIDKETGLSVVGRRALIDKTVPLAMTEWNVNCWFKGNAKAAKPEDDLFVYGLGAASYMHAMLRVSNRLKIANQSLLVGTSWDITSIRVDPNGEHPPTMYPTGMVTGMYSRNHGDQLLKIESEHVPYYHQTLHMSGIHPHEKVAELDVVVTASEDQYFVHVLNRTYDVDHALIIEFPGDVASGYRELLLSGESAGALSQLADIIETQHTGAERKTQIKIPAKAVAIFIFNKAL